MLRQAQGDSLCWFPFFSSLRGKMPPCSLTHLKKGLEPCMATINRRQGKESRAFNQCLVSLQNPTSLLFPNLNAFGVSKGYIYTFFHIGQVLITRKQKSFPNVAKYKAKLQPRGRCELSKSKENFLRVILFREVG